MTESIDSPQRLFLLVIYNSDNSKRESHITYSETSFNIQKTWRSIFYQTTQLVRCFDFNPGTPITAAYLSILFQQLNFEPSLKELHSWLFGYITPFANDTPRDQADQYEKILAIAVYLWISDQNNYETRLSERNLIDYLEYASEQAWLDTPFLAYYCHHLRENIVACQDVDKYFLNKFSNYLNKQHVTVICQGLLVVGNQLSLSDRNKYYQFIVEAANKKDLSLTQASWVLMALSQLHSSEYIELTNLLTQSIESALTECLSILTQEVRLPGILALLWSGAERMELKDYLQSQLVSSLGAPITIDLDNSILSIDFSGHNSRDLNLPSVTDISLALVALHASGRHCLIGVMETEEGRLVSALQKAELVEKSGAIVLSYLENIASNLLAIISTLLVGAIGIAYFSGVEWGYSIGLSKVSIDLETFLFFIVWLDYLTAQIQALFLGKSAFSGMLQIPLLRYLPLLLQGLIELWHKLVAKTRRA